MHLLVCLTCWAALPNLQAESEQTNSALALGVCIGRDLRVRSAGGYLVQVFCGVHAAARVHLAVAVLQCDEAAASSSILQCDEASLLACEQLKQQEGGCAVPAIREESNRFWKSCHARWGYCITWTVVLC